jgi:hypothetical protein
LESFAGQNNENHHVPTFLSSRSNECKCGHGASETSRKRRTKPWESLGDLGDGPHKFSAKVRATPGRADMRRVSTVPFLP